MQDAKAFINKYRNKIRYISILKQNLLSGTFSRPDSPSVISFQLSK